MNKLNVPLCEKYSLSIAEAVAYFGIGEKKLRKLIDENQHAKWFIQNGVKYLVKRELFEKFLDEVTTI